jgi:hypothetical protein
MGRKDAAKRPRRSEPPSTQHAEDNRLAEQRVIDEEVARTGEGRRNVAEHGRSSAERKRRVEESKRQWAEVRREDAEALREAAENVRRAGEEARIAAEALRSATDIARAAAAEQLQIVDEMRQTLAILAARNHAR